MLASLDATYALPETTLLNHARRIFAAAGTGSPAAARLAEAVQGRPGEQPLIDNQHRYAALATTAYRPGIPNLTAYRNWTQPAYNQLLAWSTYAIVANQANALTALTAYATGNPALGRQQVRADTLWAAYIFMYLEGGLATPHGTTTAELLPEFHS
jgi:hypothetical protein